MLRVRTVILFVLIPIFSCDNKRVTADAATDAAPVVEASVVNTSPPASVFLAAPESVACQHVLVAFKGAKNAPANVTRTKTEAKARANEVRKKALAGDDFADLAKTYSDDPGSRERLGSVGKFKRDGMVKPFSDVAFALPVDGVSDVVETPFGFHVIKRNQ